MIGVNILFVILLQMTKKFRTASTETNVWSNVKKARKKVLPTLVLTTALLTTLGQKGQAQKQAVNYSKPQETTQSSVEFEMHTQEQDSTTYQVNEKDFLSWNPQKGKEKNASKEEEKNAKAFSTFWSVWIANKWYLSAAWAITSENLTYSAVAGIRHKSWLWATVVRLDDMTDNPFWRITGASLSYARKFWLPKNWNFSVTADAMYVDFDNARDLNSIKPNVALKFGKDIYSIELFSLYTAYLNWETPSSAVVKLQWAIQATKTTNVSIKWRWNNANPDLKKQFYWAIWVNQALPKGFSVWLEWLYKDKKPQIIFGINKSF